MRMKEGTEREEDNEKSKRIKLIIRRRKGRRD